MRSDIIASPSVRALARGKGVDLDQLAVRLGRTTIGPEDLDSGNRSTAVDRPERYWEVDHSTFGPVTSEPVSRIARVASANLAAANAMIPQVTHHDQAELTAIDLFRAQLRPEAEARGIRLTSLAFHVKALARTLRAFPRFNASLSADGETLILKGYVHIGIAVDTPHGLLVPVLRDVDRKGLWQIAAEISDLAARAQARKIAPHEMGGASMTISNLGGISGTAFTPIVNPPELAILGITRSQIVPVWGGEAFRPVPMVPLDLSYDHRVLNGADAARFLSDLCARLADPRRMLI